MTMSALTTMPPLEWFPLQQQTPPQEEASQSQRQPHPQPVQGNPLPSASASIMAIGSREGHVAVVLTPQPATALAAATTTPSVSSSSLSPSPMLLVWGGYYAEVDESIAVEGTWTVIGVPLLLDAAVAPASTSVSASGAAAVVEPPPTVAVLSAGPARALGSFPLLERDGATCHAIAPHTALCFGGLDGNFNATDTTTLVTLRDAHGGTGGEAGAGGQVLDVRPLPLEACPAARTPPARARHTAALVPTRDGVALVVFGGEDDEAKPLGDLWVLRLQQSTRGNRKTGSADQRIEEEDVCEWSGQWLPVTLPAAMGGAAQIPSPLVGPSARSLAALVPLPQGACIQFYGAGHSTTTEKKSYSGGSLLLLYGGTGCNSGDEPSGDRTLGENSGAHQQVQQQGRATYNDLWLLDLCLVDSAVAAASASWVRLDNNTTTIHSHDETGSRRWSCLPRVNGHAGVVVVSALTSPTGDACSPPSLSSLSAVCVSVAFFGGKDFVEGHDQFLSVRLLFSQEGGRVGCDWALQPLPARLVADDDAHACKQGGVNGGGGGSGAGHVSFATGDEGGTSDGRWPHYRYTAASVVLPSSSPLSPSWWWLLVSGTCRHSDPTTVYACPLPH